MKKTTAILLAMGALCSPLSLTTAQAENAAAATQTVGDIKVEVSIHPSEGFMDGGWGNINFKFLNPDNKDVTVQKVSGDWKIKDEQFRHWDQNVNMAMKDKPEGGHCVTTPMLGNAKKLTKEKGAVPYVEGVVTLSNGQEIPYSIEIPAAELASPIQSHKGKYVSVDLQEITWNALENPKKILYYLDQAYYHMQQLTGNTPFGGKTSVILEAPRNPYFAYAGNPIILNTEYVINSAKEFDNDQLCFGWIHEMGHNFDDGIGGWYNTAGFTEMQANFKLSYVADMMCTEKSKYRVKSWRDHKSLLTGKEFNDEYFLGFADAYLAGDKDWKDMASDEHHAIFLTVIRKKGWGVAKKFYRTYVKLNKSGMQAPQDTEGKLKLLYAVLDHCSGTNLAPLYAKWRIPLDEQEMKALIKQYKIK